MPQNKSRRVIHLSDLDRRRAREIRYYCPACGMVRAEKDIGGVSQVITKVSPARVIGHIMNGLGSGPKQTCPGGEIDLVKDRAP